MNIKKTLGLCALAVLVIAAVVLGVRVYGLLDMTQLEMSLTPTPVPQGGNIMAVTVDPAAPTPAPVLRHGAQGEDVKALQSRLKTLGYYSGEIDGQFGSGTREAVAWFQRENGLDADGIVGEATSGVLYSTSARPAPSESDPTAAVPAMADADAPLLVNRDNPLPDGYQPRELVNLSDYCDGSLVIIKEEGTQAERVAADALMAMLRAAHQDGLTVWQVSAGYRTDAVQQSLFDTQVAEYMNKNDLSQEDAISATRLTVAEPGTSEHQLGLALDLTVPGYFFKDTQQAAWLAEHCWEYGFILRYTKEKEQITGFLAEPWHVRYVGVAHALSMRDSGLCLEEYLAQSAR